MVTPGTRIGPYEVVAQLGAGGMGEVYRARDAKLGRDVAIKILPQSVAMEPDRMARFEREAQTLASLNHPNIAQIYGVLESPCALVMELVEGQDLAERLARGAIPLDDVIRMARQIADGLEAAHERNIVHRDLKPANVKLRADGVVKILDFGLAKAREEAAHEPNGATITSPALLTQQGIVLGTAAYMAPEQARGLPVDRRADIWAFGCVLFEMLTGRRPFDGSSISDVIAAVLKSDPDWTTLPDDTPPPIRRLLRRCLEKDPQKRLSAIADARLELDDAMAPQAGERVTHVATKRSPLAFAWPALAGILITAAIAAAMWPRATPSAAPLQRLTILPPPGASIVPDSNAVALSPDGTMVTFVVGDPGRSDAQLWVRSLDSTTARRLDDGDGATLPFWSPDSRQIGFFTGRQLKAIPAAGGRAQVIADVAGGRGAAWGPSNVIVYAGDVNGPLFKIPASGGTPVQITTLDAGRKERGHRFPSFLPDGEHFLYAALPAREGRFDIFAGSLNGNAPVRIGVLDTAPVYAAPGYLLYARQGVLTAQPFDVKTLKFTGDPISLEDEPATVLNPITSLTAARPVTLAANGSLAYFSTASNRSVAAWYDAAGRRTGTLTVPPGHYESVNISPDGTHAVFVRSASPSESSLWVMDLARGIVSPLSSRPGRNYSPVWSPDSSQVLFASDRDGAVDFMIKGIADTTPERVFYQSDAIFKNPTDWSRAARAIVFAQIDPGTGLNVYRLAEDGTGAPVPLVVGPNRDTFGHVSPDGRWLAYGSDDTGRYQVYVEPFGRPGRRVQVSQDGAIYHAWMADGRGLLFAADTLQAVMRADISGTDNPIASAPRLVVTLPANVEFADVTPDGQRFLAILPEQTGIGSITVVQNWRAALQHRSQR